jgi:hypothetical protein
MKIICFVCGHAATRQRSLTQLSTPPTGMGDAVPLCCACDEDWTFALLSIVRLDLAGLNVLAHPKPNAPDPRRNHQNPHS